MREGGTAALLAALACAHAQPSTLASCLRATGSAALSVCCVSRCLLPNGPGHNLGLLLYAAMNSGELSVAQAYADKAVDMPRVYGPMNMADGEWRRGGCVSVLACRQQTLTGCSMLCTTHTAGTALRLAALCARRARADHEAPHPGALC